METVTACIAGEDAYTYQCLELNEDGSKLHPECGDYWHIVTPSQIAAMRAAGDPEVYFIISHIPELDAVEWDWAHPYDKNGKPLWKDE